MTDVSSENVFWQFVFNFNGLYDNSLVLMNKCVDIYFFKLECLHEKNVENPGLNDPLQELELNFKDTLCFDICSL